MAIAAHLVVSRGDVLWRATLDGVLIRVPGADEVVKLAGTGAAVWAALETSQSFGSLCDQLAGIHDADADRIAADLEPVITDLVDRDVVRVDD